jgi:hypothetical protein
MSHANPGLRPGLSSAVPTGLDFEMVVLRHTLKAVPLKEKRTSWACGPSKVMKNASVQQLLSIEPLPFPFVIPTRISCRAALDKIACAPFS